MTTPAAVKAAAPEPAANRPASAVCWRATREAPPAVISTAAIVAAAIIPGSPVSAPAVVATPVIPAIPRPGADEDAAREPARTIVAVRRARIRVVVIVTVAARRSRTHV